MSTPELLHRLRDLSERRTAFVYDLRGECQVYGGVVAAYRATDDGPSFATLGEAVHHALGHDGIVAMKRDEVGITAFHSCRLFTDEGQALRFARDQGASRIVNLNRDREVALGPDPTAPKAHADPLHSGRSMEAA
jgi:hypothetical protein